MEKIVEVRAREVPSKPQPSSNGVEAGVESVVQRPRGKFTTPSERTDREVDWAERAIRGIPRFIGDVPKAFWMLGKDAASAWREFVKQPPSPAEIALHTGRLRESVPAPATSEEPLTLDVGKMIGSKDALERTIAARAQGNRIVERTAVNVADALADPRKRRELFHHAVYHDTPDGRLITFFNAPRSKGQELKVFLATAFPGVKAVSPAGYGKDWDAFFVEMEKGQSLPDWKGLGEPGAQEAYTDLVVKERNWLKHRLKAISRAFKKGDGTMEAFVLQQSFGSIDPNSPEGRGMIDAERETLIEQFVRARVEPGDPLLIQLRDAFSVEETGKIVDALKNRINKIATDDRVAAEALPLREPTWFGKGSVHRFPEQDQVWLQAWSEAASVNGPQTVDLHATFGPVEDVLARAQARTDDRFILNEIRSTLLDLADPAKRPQYTDAIEEWNLGRGTVLSFRNGKRWPQAFRLRLLAEYAMPDDAKVQRVETTPRQDLLYRA